MDLPDDDHHLDLSSDDDLVEVIVNRSFPAPNAGGLILPQSEPSSARATPPTSQPPHARRRRTAVRSQSTVTTTRTTTTTTTTTAQTQTQPQPAAVIDLTEEPDSPEQPSQPTFASQWQWQSQGGTSHWNPRRTNSLRASPPRLARSDSTFFGQAASIIDLTVESPEEERPSDHTRSRTAQSNGRHRPRPDELIELEFLRSAPRRSGVPGLTIGLRRMFADIPGALLNFHPPQMDISLNAFAPREPSPKPPMEAIPPTREGFTRDTCAEPEEGSERVVICPACSEELAYDPTGTTSQSPASGRKRKRAPGEHHFWALKKCGHVYCADCFENRRPTKTHRNGAGFACPPGKVPYEAVNELRCAVDGCDTKIATKGEWVGIFL